MTEITPLLQQQRNVLPCNAVLKTEDDLEGEVEHSVDEADCEIPLLEIVSTLFVEWYRNGANEDLTPQDIMAMHLQYRQVTQGRKLFHAQHAIMNELADAILGTRQVQPYNGDRFVDEFRHNILRNLRENWQSIIEYDENLARNLNVYHPPTYRERIQNAWMNCIRKYGTLLSFFSHFNCKLLLIIILLGWPLSFLIMGTKFMSQCSVNSCLPDLMVAVGLMGIVALLSRLVLLFIEKWCWFPVRTVISTFWTVLKLMEFVSLLTLIIQVWFFFGDSPSFDSNHPNFCNKTLYSFMFWMKHFSSAFALVWMATHFMKTVFWLLRIRYHYMPPFDEYSEL